MNLIFLSSSSFCLPMLESIINAQNHKVTLLELFETQHNYLNTNFKYQTIQPTWWKGRDFLEQVKTQMSLQTNIFETDIELSCVITQPDSNNHGKIVQNPVAKYCREQKIKLFQPQKLNLETSELLDSVPDIDLAILASYGQILSSKVLQIPKFGFVNWHPSELPKYRGPTPMQSALINGDTSTALTWLEMTKEMDAGDIWLQIPYLIKRTENFDQLSTILAIYGANTWALGAVMKILNRN